MILKDKIAVVYGGAGAIGAGVAHTFAKEGAKVFLAGRTKSTLETIANEIKNEGGFAEYAVVDVLDEAAVDKQLQDIVSRHEKIDISVNVTGIPHKGVQGIALMDLSPDAYVSPVAYYLRSNFITAKISGKYMSRQKSGVILTATATAGRVPFPNVGGIAPTWAAMEALSRGFAAELGPQGIRVVCIRSEGMPETPLVKEVTGLLRPAVQTYGTDDLQTLLSAGTMLRKLPTVTDFANTAAFLASDRAGCITSTVTNISCGRISD